MVSRMIRCTKPVLAVLFASFMMSSIFVGASWDGTDITLLNLNRESHTLSASDIVIDGNLSTGEWIDAVHKIQWYMDADPSNSDGYNYMYLDEDPWNLYVALDLCSDQTNNTAGEWVGLWLNTNETAINDPLWDYPMEWEAALNKGIESLVHDIENEQTIQFFSDDGTYATRTFYAPEWIAVDGTATGVPYDIWYDDNQYLDMTSEYNGTHYVYRLDIDLDLLDFFHIFEELYAEYAYMTRVWTTSFSNATIDEHFLSVSDNSGNLNPDINFPLNTGTSEVSSYFDIYQENYTSNTNLRISMNGVFDAPFNTSHELVRLEVFYNDTTNIGQRTVYPYASITDYEVAWAFGPSENNASDHRSFEFKIPKSELEGYEMDTDLGIIAGGYGTLASWPGTHRWVLQGSVQTGILEEVSSEYLNYTMPMKGWTPPGVPVLNAISPNPDLDGNVSLNWNDDIAAENWTVYRHSSEIDKAHLALATKIATGLTDSEYEDTGLSEGTYWYAVEAVDSFGYTHLSNSVSVTVEFPVPTPTTPTTPTTPLPFDPTLILVLGGAGVAILLVVVVVFMRKR